MGLNIRTEMYLTESSSPWRMWGGLRQLRSNMLTSHSARKVPRRCASLDDAPLAWLGEVGEPAARPYTALAVRHTALAVRHFPCVIPSTGGARDLARIV